MSEDGLDPHGTMVVSPCFRDSIIWWEKNIAMAVFPVEFPQRPVEFRSQLAAGYEERQEQRLKDAPEIMGKSYPLVNIQKNHWTWPFIVSFPIKHGDFP